MAIILSWHYVIDAFVDEGFKREECGCVLLQVVKVLRDSQGCGFVLLSKGGGD